MGLSVFLAGTGVLLGLTVMAGLLLRSDANRMANALLAASLGCNLGYLTLVVLLYSGILADYPALSVLGYTYTLSSPLLFGYIVVMTQRDFRFKWAHLLHCWPLLPIMLLGSISGDNTGFSNETLAQARGGWPPNNLALSAMIIYAVSVVYLGAGLRLVHRHEQRLVDEFSYKESITLRWLKVLVTLCLVLALGGLVIALLRLLPDTDLWPRSIYSTLTIIALYYLIAFFGLSQPDVFAGQRKEDTVTPESTRQSAGKLPPEESTKLWQMVQNYMQAEKPYLEHELRIADLAERLEIPPAQLSQVINQCAQKNFFDFVSSYRVQFASELLASSEASMVQIAQDAGFNSQSAFYRQFKKVAGMAPKEYQRHLASNLSSGRNGDSL
jgi:AraC-like DNA-binding protein